MRPKGNQTGLRFKGLKLRLQRNWMMIKAIRAYHPKRLKTRFRCPAQVQVQTIDRCNASCLMCPYSDSEKTGPPNYMDEALYKRILKELKLAGRVHSFLPMLQNEPLLDPAIARRIQEAKDTLGTRASIHLVTNGSLLSSGMAEKLVTAGLDSLSVSIGAFREETYRIIHKGLSFKKVVGNLQALLQKDPPILVIARFLKQQANEGEEKMFVRFWKDQGAKILLHSMVNRAGTLQSFEQIEQKNTKPIKRRFHLIMNRIFPFCLLPFFTLTVLWDGRVILCCHDWGPGVVLGDLSKQSLTEVWNGEAMNYHRHLLYSGHSKKSPSCENCSLKNGLWYVPTRLQKK